MKTSFNAATDGLVGLQGWEVSIGLEVCVELTALKTKMFCGCSVDACAEPNTHTCPVCLGLPGALPAPNKAAIEAALLVGLATHCDIKKNVMLHREYSTHPTVPNKYQIVQAFPAFCAQGYLEVETSLATKSKEISLASADEALESSVSEKPCSVEDKSSVRVGIAHICIEGSKGKAIPFREKGGAKNNREACNDTRCLIDYNRAGVPLLKLVTEPDLQTPDQACLFVQKLCEMYDSLGLLKASAKKDFLCCSAFVSLKPHSCAEDRAVVKIANIYSLDDLHSALVYEIHRQVKALECGDKIEQEEHFWNASNQGVVVRRVGGPSEHLRMYPDPDIPAFCLSDEYIEALRLRLCKQLAQPL